MRSHLYISLLILLAITLAGPAPALAHGDDEGAGGHGGHGVDMAERLPDDAKTFRWPDEPMGWALRVHLVLCLFSHVFLLPVAMVMEFARYKHQALAQVAGALVGLVGMAFGWANGGLNNIYRRFGWFMLSLLIVQTTLNLTTTMRVLERSERVVFAYRFVGSVQFVFTYMAMVLGGITFLSLCSTGHLGQCVSHFIRGSVLILTSVFIMTAMRICGPLIVDLKRPMEFFECLLIMTVGLIGTFTEHNFFQSTDDKSGTWSHKDLQHTLIGISWLAGGLLGTLMTWKNHPRDRSAIPSLIFMATGISMIIHQQDLVMSSRVHFLFGAALLCLGISTICEITLVSSEYVKERGEPAPFQYVPILFMCASGMFLMGANRDMVLFLINSKVDVATYALILLSFCFVILFYFYILVDLYFFLAGDRIPRAKYHQLPGSDEAMHNADGDQQPDIHAQPLGEQRPPPQRRGFYAPDVCSVKTTRSILLFATDTFCFCFFCPCSILPLMPRGCGVALYLFIYSGQLINLLIKPLLQASTSVLGGGRGGGGIMCASACFPCCLSASAEPQPANPERMK